MLDLSTAGEREGPFALLMISTSFHGNHFLTGPLPVPFTQGSLGLNRHTERSIQSPENCIYSDNVRGSDHCHSHGRYMITLLTEYPSMASPRLTKSCTSHSQSNPIISLYFSSLVRLQLSEAIQLGLESGPVVLTTRHQGLRICKRMHIPERCVHV